MDADLFAQTARVEMEHWWFVGRRRVLAALARELVSPPALVVDVGCGVGGNTAALGTEHAVVGMDVSEAALAHARRRFPHVRFIQGSRLEDLGPEREAVGLALLADVLEHVEDDRAFLAGLVGACPAGAHILLTAPANPALWGAHDEVHGHYRRYDRQRFELVWHDLPVTARMVSHFSSRLYPLLWTVRATCRLRRPGLAKTTPDLWMPPRPVNRALARIFAGEASRLVGLLRGRLSRGYARGSSLIAVLRRN
jgi:SAM-dependent methyltransferase